MTFPEIPNAKKYNGNLTPEQNAQMKLVQGIPLAQSDLDALQESVLFYEKAYPFLKSIVLSNITEAEKNEIVAFLDVVLNYQVFIQNNLRFKNLFRVTFVRDEFLEAGKVRNTNYISFPPAEIVKQNGKYGRANSPNSTCLYCAFNPIIALLETKPKVGDRIIISQWYKKDDLPFVSFPIVNNNTVQNAGLEKGTKEFKDRMSYNHPLFARILDLLFDFLSSEFIKSSPVISDKAFEYLYSSYFSDIILNSAVEPRAHPIEPLGNYDCIIYPSIAAGHKTDNIAIRPSSVTRLQPIYLEDIIVTATDYGNATIYENAFPEEIDLPIARQLLRTSNNVRNGKIVWSDDQ